MKTKTKNKTPYKKGRATKKTGGNIASGYQIQKEFLSLFEYEKFRAQMMSTVECNLQLAVFFFCGTHTKLTQLQLQQSL